MIMKNRVIALLFVIFSLFSCCVFCSCGNEDEIVTDVKFTIHSTEENGTLISFYMTSDTEPMGFWEYSLENEEIFSEFFFNEQTNEYGFLGKGGIGSYKTLILKPIKEGTTSISFNLTKGEKKYSFSLTAKEEDGKLVISASEIK